MAIVYRHIRLDTGRPFYIGIGKHIKRAFLKGKSRGTHWSGVVKKYGYEVEILFYDLTWAKACEKEIEFIKLYGRLDKGTGILVNKTDGGEGCHGTVQSEEARLKMSKAKKGKYIGNKNPNFGKRGEKSPLFGRIGANKGKKQSEEIKRKRSIAMTGLLAGEKHPMYGRRGEDSPMFGRFGKNHPAFGTGGENHGNFGRVHSAEVQAKKSKTMKDKWASDNHNWKPKSGEENKNFGKKHSAEWSANMSKNSV